VALAVIDLPPVAVLAAAATILVAGVATGLRQHKAGEIRTANV
jgi:hypothetical protein